MSATRSDRGGLFLQPPSDDPAEQQAQAVDGSGEGMRRLRFPFEADPVDVLEQQLTVPVDEDEYR